MKLIYLKYIFIVQTLTSSIHFIIQSLAPASGLNGVG